MYRILCIDGGGVRGIVAAMVLADLERRAARPVADLFDLVAATSTGAVVALGLLRPGAEDKPARSAREVAEFYEDTSQQVFSRSAWRRFRTADGFLGPKYSSSALEQSLRQEFGETMLSQSLCHLIVPTYDLKERLPYFFKTSDVAKGRQADQPLWRVARATSAAPTYFAPAAVRDADRQLWLIDGGVCANNPSVCAYADAVRGTDDKSNVDKDVRLVSVGTGAISTDYAVPKTLHGGKLSWATPMFDVVLDAQEDTASYHMEQVLEKGRTYFRFQADLPEARPHEPSWVSEIDNAGPRNMAMLKDSAQDLIDLEAKCLDTVAEEFQPSVGAVT